MIVAANKIDIVTDEKKLDEFMDFIKKEGKPVFEISAATKKGIKELLNEVLYRLETYEEPEEEQIKLFDLEKDDREDDFKKITGYKAEDGVYVLEGKQLSKIFRSTNFTDMGSTRYLYKYIVNRGGIKQLRKLGLKEGDTVRIEDYEFEYTED